MLWDKIQTEIEKQNSESLIKVDCTGYPLGLLGPLAGRLVENLSKPVFCFLEKDNILKEEFFTKYDIIQKINLTDFFKDLTMIIAKKL